MRPEATQGEAASVSALVDQLLELKKKLINPDVIFPEEKLVYTGREFLGCYWPDSGEIEIHWVAIGMFVALFDEYKHSVENVTAFVLAHELAHAYTHRGFDTDGRQWGKRDNRSKKLDLRDFTETSIFIIEGLAQYYTGVVSESMERIQPGMHKAFEDLLGYQKEHYKDFRNWIPKHPNQREIVRLVMIESTRARRIQNYDLFKSELDRFAEEWSGDGG